MTPLPPLPAIAIERLDAAGGVRRREGAIAVALSCVPTTLSMACSCQAMPTVDVWNARGALMQIKAPPRAGVEHASNRYYGTVIRRRSMRIEGHRWQMSAVNAPLSREAVAFEAGDGEVVVKIAGCGVCHTDLGYLYDGVRTNQPLPLALGHEISGTVVATGRGAEAWLDKAVIVPAVLPCGECDHCRRGLPTI